MAEKEYNISSGSFAKPEKTMKLRYIGESFYLFGLTDGKIYEA